MPGGTQSKRSLRPRCPKCESRRVVRICYGLMERGTAERHPTMVMGGCCIDDDSPAWFCHDCRHHWGKVGDVPGYWETEEDLTQLPPN